MKISKLIENLQAIRAEHGDLKVELIIGPTSDIRGDAIEVWVIKDYSVVIESY